MPTTFCSALLSSSVTSELAPSAFTTVCSVGLICSVGSFLGSFFLFCSFTSLLGVSYLEDSFFLPITLCSFAGSFVLTVAEVFASTAIAGVDPKAIAAPAITPAAPAERAATLRISTAFATPLLTAESNAFFAILLACLPDFVVIFIFFPLEK
ncbi:Uncharacterised protein [Chlamydia trachomatis]|nr:Uncharacterised protein [Chlamydia trachomatis]